MGTKLKILGKKKSLNQMLKDPRWTVKDKIFEYKGVLKLQGRQKKKNNVEAASLQKKICKELSTLKAEVKEFRGLLKEVQYGDRRRLHTILAKHKDLQLAYAEHDPDLVYHAVVDDCDSKRRQLDELNYLKTLKIKEFFDLKLEWASVINECEDQDTLKDPDPYKRKVVYRHDKAIANKQAAESLRLTYLLMIDSLEKDRYQFDTILQALGNDKKEQRQLVVKAKQFGQLAAHDLKEMREVYDKMAVKVWKNIKEREKALKIIRERVGNLWSNVRLLVRVESDTKYIGKLSEKSPTIDKSLEEEVQSVEATFERVKDALLTRSYDEFLTRFKEQARQRTRLLKLLEKSLEERDSLLNKKNNAILILNNLKDSISTNGDYDGYKAKKKEMLRQLEIEKKREVDFTKLRKSRGALLINIKTALQNMLVMMVCIQSGMGGKQKASKDKKSKDKKGRRSETKLDKGQMRQKLRSLSTDECELETIDTDAINLLTQVTKKATILFGMCSIDLTPEEEEQAKNLYQSYVAECKSRALFAKQDSEFGVLVIEHEIVDPSVLSRDDIKSQSKHLVDIKTKANESSK